MSKDFPSDMSDVVVRRIPQRFVNNPAHKARENRFSRLRADFMNNRDIHSTGSPPLVNRRK